MRLDTKEAADILKHSQVQPLTLSMHDEGYVLVTEGNTTYDIAATSAGLYYGAQTIKQLIGWQLCTRQWSVSLQCRAAWCVDSRLLAGDEISRGR